MNYIHFFHGLTSKYYNDTRREELQIHRNGCIQYIRYYTKKEKSIILLSYSHMAKKIMQILQFVNTMFSNYNYFGDVKIISTLNSSSNSVILDKDGI